MKSFDKIYDFILYYKMIFRGGIGLYIEISYKFYNNFEDSVPWLSGYPLG